MDGAEFPSRELAQMPPPSLDSQVQGVEEQIHFLQLYTFPAQVSARKMTQARADRKLEVLRAAATSLRQLRDAEAARRDAAHG